MLDVQSKITNAMLQLQMLLDEAGLDENESVQDAFNALATALDEEVVGE
jgi:type VI protein secretion system component VasF